MMQNKKLKKKLFKKHPSHNVGSHLKCLGEPFKEGQPNLPNNYKIKKIIF
jgi:hypothetical protein